MFLQRHFMYLYMSFVCAACIYYILYTILYTIVRILVTHGRPLCVTADGRIALDLRTVAAFVLFCFCFVWTDFVFSILQISIYILRFTFCILVPMAG